MLLDVPPPGRALPFDEWATSIVAGVRSYIPDAKAARKGRRLVIIRHSGLEGHLREDGSAYWITFRADGNTPTLASMYDIRCDYFTVNNFARSILMRARNLVSLSRRNHSSYRDSAF